MRRLIITAIVLFVLVLTGASLRSATPEVQAQSKSGGDTYFLKFDGLEGETTDAGHAGETAVTSFVWNQTRPVGTSVLVTPKAIHTVLKFDKSAPLFLRKVATGERTAKATLTVRNSKGQDYMKWVFTDAVVTGFEVMGDTMMAPRPQIALDFLFSKVDVEYRVPLLNGGMSAAVKGWWELNR